MPVGDATVALTDEGLLRGDGAFEMLRLYAGRPFAMHDHLQRLDATCRGVFLDWDRAAFEREIDALLEANDDPGAALRLVLTRGGRRIAIIEEMPSAYGHGITLSSVRYQPTEVLNGLKTLSYAGNMLATRIAKRDGADEALLVRPNGNVLEAPTSSIFWVDRDGALHTPKVDTGVLASITRQRIMELVPVEERDSYSLTDVLDATEAFLASSLREVQGVSVIDGLEFACPGPVTARVAALFSERIEAELGAAGQ
jgi:branched-chain amino acid aminotransferase